jgi:hypothetical protein
VRLARSADFEVRQFALSAMSVATTHAAGRTALLSAGGAAAALEAELAQPSSAPLLRRRGERATLEGVRASASDALRRLRDPRARLEHEPPGDAPPPGADGTAALRGWPVVCIACGAEPSPGRPLKHCSACRGPERWCGAACQRATWAAHKPECRQRTAGEAAAGAPAGAGGSG